MEDPFVSAAEAARRIGQSERTIRRWIERGKLKARKHGSTFQIALSDLDQFVASRTPDVNTLLNIPLFFFIESRLFQFLSPLAAAWCLTTPGTSPS